MADATSMPSNHSRLPHATLALPRTTTRKWLEGTGKTPCPPTTNQTATLALGDAVASSHVKHVLMAGDDIDVNDVTLQWWRASIGANDHIT